MTLGGSAGIVLGCDLMCKKSCIVRMYWCYQIAPISLGSIDQIMRTSWNTCKNVYIVENR